MWEKIVGFVSLKLISPFKWTFLKFFFTGRAYDLRPADREAARELMSFRTYVWVSRRDTHLTTYLISFSDWVLSLWAWIKNGCENKRPRFGFWSHAFLNYDNNELVEAVAKGVKRTFFDEVFDCDAVAALVPKNLSIDEWASLQPFIAEEMLNQLGKKYDTVFDLSEDERVSCIELVRVVLKKRVPDYDLKFANFETMIQLYKNVTPQMLYESEDFVCVWEVRRK
jgi:hypothetical protein